MSKYTAEQLIKTSEALCGLVGMADLTDAAGMLREYAAHLARQSGGVGGSDELPDDIRVPLDEVRADLGYLFGRVAADGSFMQAAVDSVRLKLDKVRAALQSVRPPVGVVSDDRLQKAIGALLWINEEVWPLVHELTSRETLRKRFRELPSLIEYLASRHAPTKD